MKNDTAPHIVALLILLRGTDTPQEEMTPRQCAHEAELQRRLQIVTEALHDRGSLPQTYLTELLRSTLGIGRTTARVFLAVAHRRKWLRRHTVRRHGHYTIRYSLPQERH